MNTIAPSNEVSPADRLQELQETVSATRLNCWLQCRLKFYFRYVLRLRKPSTASLHVGSIVHAVLQAWNRARWKREPFRVEKFRTVFDSEWQLHQKVEPVQWGGEEEEERKGAWVLLETYFAETPIKADEKPEAVEVPVEADLAMHGLPVLVGIIDLVRAGGRIVDFKTAAQTPGERTSHLHELQTTSYAVLYRECAGHRESGIELHHLVKMKKPKIIVTPLEPMTEWQQNGPSTARNNGGFGHQ